MGVLVVLPTYQEAANVAAVLRRLRSAVPAAAVLVVDDGSPDGTADIAEAVDAELGGITVLRRDRKQGLGAAYRAGFEWGLGRGFDVLVEMDADLSHDPASLPVMLRALDREDADLVVGSRYAPGGTMPGWPAHRKLLSRWGNRFADAALRLDLLDATSGYRVYRADMLRRMSLERVRAGGYAFQVEMAYRVQQAGGVIVEVPIEFHDRTLGASKLSYRIIAEALVLVTFWGARDRVGERLGARWGRRRR